MGVQHLRPTRVGLGTFFTRHADMRHHNCQGSIKASACWLKLPEGATADIEVAITSLVRQRFEVAQKLAESSDSTEGPPAVEQCTKFKSAMGFLLYS